MKKIYLIMCFMLLTICGTYAQTGSLKGQITSSDGKPAPHVSIGLKGHKQGTTSDENGSFTINKIKVGHYTILASFVGLATLEQSVEIIEGQTATINFSLKETANQLDEVVVKTGSAYKSNEVSSSLRLMTPILETPQNIQVITSKVLASQQITSMSDGVLRNISGASRVEHWGDMYARVNMRGSRASAFRNGMNVTSNWGPLTEDMSFVEYIEFVKGPAGFLMSNGEPSGIYNVVTKKPTGQTKGEANMTFGSFDFYRATLDLDGKLNDSGKLLYRLNIMGQTKNSFRPYEYAKRYSIAPVVSYKIDEQTTLTAEYTLQYANMSNVGSYYVFGTEGYASKPREFTLAEPGLDPTKINDQSILINLQHNFNSDWKLTTQAAYFNYDQVGSSMWQAGVFNNGSVVRQVSIWDALNESKYAQVFVNGDIQTGPVRHRILGGIDLGNKQYIADWGTTFKLDTIGSFNINNPVYGKPYYGYPTFNRNKSLRQRANTTAINQTYTGLYFQDELGFLQNKIRLTLAGRYTDVKENSYGTVTKGKKFTPRVGLSVSLDEGSSVYALYDQTFVPQTGVIRSGEKVKPISGNNIEAGIKRDWFNNKWNTTLSLYRIIKNNQLSADPGNAAGESFSLQLGQTQTEGIEFDVRGEIVKGLSLIANYAYTDSKITRETTSLKEGAKVPGYSKHIANAWLNYRIGAGTLKGLGFAAGVSYQGDRSTWSFAPAGRDALPNYFKLDGGVSWENNKFTIAANVFNILDKYLYSGVAYATYYYWQAEAPRNSRLSINYKF